MEKEAKSIKRQRCALYDYSVFEGDGYGNSSHTTDVLRPGPNCATATQDAEASAMEGRAKSSGIHL